MRASGAGALLPAHDTPRRRVAPEGPAPTYLPFERNRLHRCTRKSVYFIQGGARGPIKIGSSADPERRIIEMQTGSPHPLRMLAVIREAIEGLEQELHRRFAYCRKHHEWFNLTPELVRFVRNLGGEPL